MSDPCYAAKQYLINLSDGTYGKIGTKITITENMVDHIKYALEQWNFWHKRTSDTVEENIRLQEENRELEARLEKAVAAEELVKLLRKIL